MMRPKFSSSAGARAACALLLCLASVALAGCEDRGDAGNNSLFGGSPGTALPHSGGLRLLLTWPGAGRLIPAAAQSVRVTLRGAAGIVAEQVVSRPPTGTSNIVFYNVPAGGLTVTVTAYPTADGSGTAQATVSMMATVQEGKTLQVPVTLVSTVESISLSPDAFTLRPGGSVHLTATPMDAGGNAVVVAADSLTWESTNTSVATVDSSGNVTAAGLGTVTIKVTYSEPEAAQQRSTTATITVIPPLLQNPSVVQAGGITGSNLGSYDFTVTYTQISNVPPAWIRAMVKNPNGTVMGTFDMAKVDSGDSNYADGCLYRFRSSVLTGGTGSYSCEFSASDGTESAALPAGGPVVTTASPWRIAFTNNSSGSFAVYTMTADGISQTQLTSVADSDPETRPSYSPDGIRIAFSSNHEGSANIYVMNVDGSGVTRLSPDAAGYAAPAWSPDGTRIACQRGTSAAADIVLLSPDGASVQPLTSTTGADVHPCWSQDGSKIAFASERDGNREIYVMNSDGSGQTRVTTDPGTDDYPTLSPDGTRLAWVSTRAGTPDIYVMSLPSGTPQRLTYGPSQNTCPAWSADGSKIAYAGATAGGLRLFMMNADGSGQTELPGTGGDYVSPAWTTGVQTPSPYSGLILAGRQVIMADGATTVPVTLTLRDGSYRPIPGASVSFWATGGSITPTGATTDSGGTAMASLTASTTGTITVHASATGARGSIEFQTQVEAVAPGRVVFHSNRAGNLDIWAMNTDGSSLAQITSDAADERNPSLSPDGRRVVYEKHAGDAIYQIWVANVDGSGPVQLTSSGSNVQPSWSPDGTKIAFVSERLGGLNLFVMDADGANQTARTFESTSSYAHPNWSPDGTRIAYGKAMMPGGPMDVWVMDAAGGGQTQLTTGNASTDVRPSWSSDGSKIVFNSARDGNDELYIMGATGTGQARITNNTVPDLCPNLLKVPAWIAYQTQGASSNDVALTSVDGLKQFWLTNDSFDDGGVSVGPLPQAPSPFTATVSSDKQLLIADGTSQAAITVAVRDGSYLPLSGASVTFGTSQGSLDNTTVTTDTGGVAAAKLTSSATMGVASVTVSAAGGMHPSLQTKVLMLQGEMVYANDSGHEIHKMWADGTNDAGLATAATTPLTLPAWSPDGSRIIYVGDCPTGGQAIRRMDANGGGAIPLTDTSLNDVAPCWSPDGATIAYASDRTGNSEIYLMDPEGTAQRQLTYTPTGSDAQTPAWSPDGTRIVFSLALGGPRCLWVVNANGSGMRRLTYPGATNEDNRPAWSPDGTRIAFRTGGPGGGGIAVINADGSGRTQVTTDPTDNYPSWSPDSKFISFQSDRTVPLGGYAYWVAAADGSAVAPVACVGSPFGPCRWSAGELAQAPYSLSISCDKGVLMADGAATNSVTVNVRDGGYRPLTGASVSLAADAGSIPSPVTTDAAGNATAVYTSGTATGLATITGTAAGGKNPTGRGYVHLVTGRIVYSTMTVRYGEIHIMNADGSGDTALTNLGSGCQPRLSPDGQWIAYTGSGEFEEIHVANADGSAMTSILPNAESPVWSPDGSKIACWMGGVIAIMQADGSNPKPVPNTGNYLKPADWSPDGKRLLLISEQWSTPEICTIHPDGTGFTRLTYSNLPKDAPRFSPDGTKISFTANGCVYVMNADGSGVTQVTQLQGPASGPAVWSPDGKCLAYSTGMDLSAVDPTGRGDTALTKTFSYHVAPDWRAPTAPDAASVNLSVDKGGVLADGVSTCTLQFQVFDAAGRPLSGPFGLDAAIAEGGGEIDSPSAPGTYATTWSATGAGSGTFHFRSATAAGHVKIKLSVTGGSNPTAIQGITMVGAGKIAFLSDRDGVQQVYTMNPDGGVQTRVTNSAGADDEPSWSPDGMRIAFSSNRDGNWEIYAIDTSGTNEIKLTSSTPNDSRCPSWSPDGSKIAFWSSRDGANGGIYVMDADGGNLTRVFDGNSWGQTIYPRLAWAPDGKHIAFLANPAQRAIYVVGADGSDVAEVGGTVGCSYFAWSPDGSQFACMLGGDIVTVPADGQGLPTLVNVGDPQAASGDRWIAYSPDGRLIAFSSDHSGNHEVYSISAADGSGLTNLTNSAALDYTPAWSSGLGQGAYTLGIVAGSPVAAANGSSTVAFTATVRGGHYEPIAGQTVKFTADKGTLDAASAVTDANGQATVTLTAGTSIGTATVTAAAAGGPRGDVVGRASTRLAGGGKIAFMGIRSAASYSVYVMDPDGSNQMRLTDPSLDCRDPRWSPDGTRIAFANMVAGHAHISAMDYNGENLSDLTTASTWDDQGPSWSPDADKIAFFSSRDGVQQIYTMGPDGGSQANLLSDLAHNYGYPAYSPDGSTIALSSDRAGSWDIYLVNSDGSNLRSIAGGAGTNLAPAWSPDGSKIAFMSDRIGGTWQIFVMNADGTGVTQVTTASASSMYPTWSPDGQRLSFSRPLGDGEDIYTINLDGTSETKLTSEGNNSRPSWSQGTDPDTGRAAGKRKTRVPEAWLRAVCAGQEALAKITVLGLEPVASGTATRGRAADAGTLRFVPAESQKGRAADAGKRTWEFTLEAPSPDADVTLSWPDLSSLGSKDRVMLEDLDTGKRRSMRTTAAYVFRAGDGGKRRFRVTAQPRAAGPALVAGLELVSAGRANARLVRFTLSSDASVDIELMSPTGRMVAPIARAREATAGLNQVPWSGMLAPGIYILKATATTEDGTAMQSVRPVAVVR